MICNETYKSTPFRNKLTRRTYSSIRCSRQTQRTQLESAENTIRSFNEQHEQYLRQGCQTISEEGDLNGQSSANQNNERCGADSCIFIRGPTQLRDSRRKTAEQWQIRKHPLVNDENCVEEIRHGQKVKFSLAVNNNKSFLRNLNNIVENKESVQISTTKHLEYSRTHLLPSLFSSSIIGPKSKSCNSESNFEFLYHSDSSYPINSYIISKKLHLKSAGLHEIHINRSMQNQIPLNEKVS
ncbi:hypothetical protein ACH3XW_43445 [Acanthocheilonema viteae]